MVVVDAHIDETDLPSVMVYLERAADWIESEAQTATRVDVGVSVFDIAFAIENDDKAAKRRLKGWIDSKQISAESIGRCPLDGRKQLYRLSELLDDVRKILSLNSHEVAKYRQVLTARLRRPRTD